MKKAIMEKWVAALRSGEYKQGVGALRCVRNYDGSSVNKFCCLGVLCNLHAQAHPGISKTQTDPDWYLGETDFLPQAVMIWAGMNSNNGKYVDKDDAGEFSTSLSEDNDCGETFAVIANIVEKNWKQL